MFSRRLACAFIDRFELAERVRHDPSLPSRLVAIADLGVGRPRIRVCSPAAEARGVVAGASVTEALAMCPSLELLAPDTDRLQRAETEILSALATCAPAIDTDGRGAFFLSLHGLGALQGTERESVERIRIAVRSLGFHARVAVADRSLAAWVAARRARPVIIVPPGADAESLADVPLSELGLPGAVEERLGILGLQSVGDLARLPPGTLSSRLPDGGAGLERFMRGETFVAWPSAANAPRADEEVGLELDGPTEAIEPLLFVTKSLLDRLLGRIVQERRALAELRIIVTLDDRSVVTHRLAPPVPTLDGRALMDLVRLWLSSSPLRSPIVAIRLVAARLGTAPAQQIRLFERQREETRNAFTVMVSRLSAAFGTEHVVRPVMRDAHRPEKRVAWVPWGEGPAATEEKSPSGPIEALLLRSPPEPVRSWDGRRLVRAQGRAVDVVAVEGPHRVGGEWWDDGFDRSYFWITGAQGERIWIFRDERTGTVFVHGVAD